MTGTPKAASLALIALSTLPLFALAWPAAGGLVDQLQPELWGTGVVGLGALAAVVLVVLLRRPVALGGLTLLLGFVALGAVTQRWKTPGDTLGASRSMMLSLSGMALLITGARLDSAGRLALVRAATLLSIAFVVPAMFGVQGHLFGTLGNTGATAQAALPGALTGALLLAGGRGAWRALGLSATLLFAAYVTIAPSITAAIALAATLAIGIFRSRRLRLGLALTLAACAVSGQVARWLDALPKAGVASSSPAETARSGSAGGNLGGIEVRRRVWASSLGMLGAAPWLGTGPGQFRTSFPPYRDPQERELSNRSSGFETEVEHVHNDWLQGVLDGGAIGGALWIAFLIVCARAAWHGMFGTEDNDRAALGAGILGILACALAHAPLTYNPASAGLFYLFAGSLLARPAGAAARSRARALMPLFAALLLAVQAPRAAAFMRYGGLMRLVPTEEAPGKRLPGRDRLQAALAHCPDAPLALRMLARDPATEDATLYWERLIALHPHNFEALVQLGGLRANEGRTDQARELWSRAHGLESQRSNVLRNLALLEARSGNARDSYGWLDILEQQADSSSHELWLHETAALELLRGREGSGKRLSRRLGGSAPQFTSTKGLPRRFESWWIRFAISSLPVPLSPWISAVDWVGATVSAISRRRFIRAERQMIGRSSPRADVRF